MRAAAVVKLEEWAAQRRQALEELMDADPGEVLGLAIPASVRDGLPAAVQDLMEQEAAMEGTLEVYYECSPGRSRLLYGLQTDRERVSLHFARDEPLDLMTGSRVRVRGVRVGTSMALNSGSSGESLQALTSALPNTFGEQKTAVILVNFQDQMTEPYTRDYARGVVFTTTSNFDLENSHNKTWLTGDVFGWYTIPINSTSCDATGIATYAKQAAAAAGIDLSVYRRFVYGFPQNACVWWGLGNVGGNPSNAWINGSFQIKVVGHEMGHNFGLNHSRTATSEYGDTLDIMGNPSSGHFNAFQKERLGWLNYSTQPPITTVETSGDYFIDAYETGASNPKALKILKSTDPSTGLKTWYYVERRTNTGFDSSFGSNSNVMNGAVVHTGSESTGNSSYLLDMTPSTATFSDPALVVGSSFADPGAGITITTVSASSSGAVVNVTLGPQTCTPAAPVLTPFSSQSQWGTPGSTLSYTLTLANRDSSGCPSTTFYLSASVPSGWSAVVSPLSATVAAGATANVTVQVTSPAAAADGLYDIQATARSSTDSTKAASAAVTYGVSAVTCVPSNPTLTALSPASPTVAAGTSVSYTVVLTNNDSASCPTTTFNIKATAPSAWTATVSPSSVTLNPGAGVNIAVTVKSPVTAADGAYNIAVSATSSADAGKTASVSLVCLLSTSLAATVSTNKGSYVPGEKVVMTATVTAAGSPVSGASVAFTVLKPNGTKASQTAKTNGNGTATYSMQLRSKDPLGTYAVSVQATAGSKSATASKTFMVAR